MSDRGRTYDDVIAMVTERFESAVAAAVQTVEEAGGRFLSHTAIKECMGNSIKATIDEASDVALLSIVATRPHLLHAEPKLYGQLPTPRQSLDHALKISVYHELSETMTARLGDGQSPETLPETAEAALVALAGIEASGKRFADSSDARRILSAGDWEDDMVYGIGMPLGEFLTEQGRPGIGNDLIAAIQAREAVMARTAGPGFR